MHKKFLPPEMAVMKISASFPPWDGRPWSQWVGNVTIEDGGKQLQVQTYSFSIVASILSGIFFIITLLDYCEYGWSNHWHRTYIKINSPFVVVAYLCVEI